jgi:hypothetical protein
VNPDAPATVWCFSTSRCSRNLPWEPQPPTRLLNWSGLPPTLTEPAKRALGVRAGGRAPACSPRRYQPLQGSLLASGVACWPSSSPSGSASPFAMLAPPQARRSEPGGAATQEGPSTWTAMLPVPGKSSGKCGGTTILCYPASLLKTLPLVVGQVHDGIGFRETPSRYRRPTIRAPEGRTEA